MRTIVGVVVAVVCASWLGGAAWAACAGDCGGDGEVSIDELILGVNIALGNAVVGQCGNMDADGDGEVTINEIIGAVNGALGGCLIVTPAATATATPTAVVPTPTSVMTSGLFISNAPPEAGSNFVHRSPITPNPVVFAIPGVVLNVTWTEFSDPVSAGAFRGAVTEVLSLNINLANGQLSAASYTVTSVPAVGSVGAPNSNYGITAICTPTAPCNAAQKGIQADLGSRTVTFSDFVLPRLNGAAVTESVTVNGSIGY